VWRYGHDRDRDPLACIPRSYQSGYDRRTIRPAGLVWSDDVRIGQDMGLSFLPVGTRDMRGRMRREADIHEQWPEGSPEKRHRAFGSDDHGPQ
jgi:hypothetical protein